MHFARSETTQSYMKGIENYVFASGRPIAFYSDRHSIFKTTRTNSSTPYDDTQMQRALKELNIDLILARSPQAKGRVERANKTLQDRLVKEMRLAKINSIEQANAFLPAFIEKHNKKFAVEAADSEDAHSSLHMTVGEMQNTLSVRDERRANKSLEFTLGNKAYQIIRPGGGYRYRKAKISIHTRWNGDQSVYYKNEQLDFKILCAPNHPEKIADRKEVNALVDESIEKLVTHTHDCCPQGTQDQNEPALL